MRAAHAFCCLVLIHIDHVLGGGTTVGSPPANPPTYKVQTNKLYTKTGLLKESAGRSCGELLSYGMTDSGVYWLKPDGYREAFQTYCDQQSFGGGWQMCYTTKHEQPRLSEDAALGYNSSKPFKTDGYVSNCKHVPFNQIIFVMHSEPKCFDKKSKKCKNFGGTSDEDEKAYFTYETTQGESLIHFLVAGNSGKNLVAPAVQMGYSELENLKKRYNVPMVDNFDHTLLGREDYAGSIASQHEVAGIWEADAARHDVRKRATDFWRGRGVAYKVSDAGEVLTNENWKYQVVICDESTKNPVGFFVSGIEGDSLGCFKTCEDWCGDTETDHYRASWGALFCNSTDNEPAWCVGKGTPESLGEEAAGTSIGPGKTAGISFKENGFRHTTYRLMSVGVRYRVQIPNSRNSAEANPTDYQHEDIWSHPHTHTRIIE